MTRDEETNERNACDEWWHAQPNKGASIQEAWVERARRAKAQPIYQLQMIGDGWSDVDKATFYAWKLNLKPEYSRIVYAAEEQQ